MIQKNKFALASASVMTLVSVLCAGLVSMAPNLAAKLAGSIMHLVNIDVGAQITLSSLVLGIIQVFVYTYILALVFAWLHNKYSLQNKINN